MNTTQEDLTAAEQRLLEQAREAESQGVTLPQYYRAAGLSLYSLYNVRRRLVNKGLLPSKRAVRPAPAKDGDFIAMRVAAPTTRPNASVCRLQHPSGWVIECSSWPPASWLAECLGGVAHAAA